jgi:hypothetical protein
MCDMALGLHIARLAGLPQLLEQALQGSGVGGQHAGHQTGLAARVELLQPRQRRPIEHAGLRQARRQGGV